LGFLPHSREEMENSRFIAPKRTIMYMSMDMKVDLINNIDISYELIPLNYCIDPEYVFDNKIFIIDETQLINDKSMFFILKILQSNSKIIFVGDLSQTFNKEKNLLELLLENKVSSIKYIERTEKIRFNTRVELSEFAKELFA
jgi:predicted ribonuclease YlaK